MINIITAMNDPILNDKLKKEQNINILINDIQYQEGILEALDKIENIDYLILTNVLPGELKFEELINKIKFKNGQIKIILIKKENMQDVNIENINYILFQNNIQIKQILSLIKNENQTETVTEIKEEIKDNKEQKKNTKKRIFQKTKNKKENNIKAEIIAVTGSNGVGKSIVTVNMAKTMALNKNKILIIDFDILNNSLHTILGVNKYPLKVKEKIKKNYKIEIEELIIKINRKIDLISGIDIILNLKEKNQIEKLEKILNKLKNKYDLIIIDTSFECFLDINKFIIEISNKSIFITGTNLLEIKKAKNLLNIYINHWKIKKAKFNIVLNKYEKESINLKILKMIFAEFNIIGELKYNKNYEKIINKHKLVKKEIRKEYININKKILKK